MCKLIEKQGDNVLPLFIDYGQLSAEKEWKACQKLLTICGFSVPEKIVVKDFGRAIPSGLTNIEKDIHDDAFLPGRNALFLTIASSYAFSKNASTVAIGILTEKHHIFPDQTDEFIVNMNFAMNSALGKNMMLLTPLINFEKKDIIKLAEKYSIPLDETYSCHSGKDKYCKKCVACREIISSEEQDKLPQFGERE